MTKAASACENQILCWACLSVQNQAAFHRQMQHFLKYWVCGTGGVPVSFTPLGRSYNANDGSLGTTANAVFLSTLYGSQVAR